MTDRPIPQACAYFTQELADSPYTVISQENRGLGSARNTAIQMAQGEFILPLDSDNYIRELYLTQGVQVLLNNPAIGVVHGDAQRFGDQYDRWFVPEFDFRIIAIENYIDACALYRRSVWDSIGGYDEQMPVMGWEDWDFWMRAALRGFRFMHLAEIAFDYRVRGDSMYRSNRDLRTSMRSGPISFKKTNTEFLK